MRDNFKKTVFFVVIFNLLPFYLTQSQDSINSISDFEQVQQYTQNKYGANHILVNGVYYENLYYKSKGHPFLFDEHFYEDNITIHNRVFNHVGIMYNIYEQNVVVRFKENGSEDVNLIPPVEFISTFECNGKKFRRLSLPGMDMQFYQAIHEGQIKCYFFMQKKRAESHHNNTYSSYQFYDTEKKQFLVINETLHTFKKNTSFIKIFPISIQNEIKKYIRQHHIRVHQSSDGQIKELILFCETHIREMPLNKTFSATNK